MAQHYTSAPARTWFTAALCALGFCGALLGTGQAQAQTIKVEAESGVLAGTAALATAITPFSGTGYVKFDQTGSLTLTVPVTATQGAGNYDMIIRYESEFDFKLVDLRVNGAAGDPNQTRYLNSTLTSGGFKSTANSRYALNVGNNTVVFTATYGYHGIDYVQFVKAPATATPLVPSATGRVEAEAGIVSGAQAYLKDGGSGQSGNLFVGNFFTPTDNVTLPVNVAAGGQYRIVVGAREDFNDKAYTIAVNGSAPVSVNIPNTLAGTAATNPFGATQAGSYALNAGTNTIVIGGAGGYFDIDYVDFVRVLAVKPSAGLSEITVYPNPSNGQNLNISLQTIKKQNADIALLNALGQRVRTSTRTLEAGQNDFQLSTTGLASGIYQVVIYINNQASALQRVVVAQ